MGELKDKDGDITGGVGGTVTSSVDVSLTPKEAFDVFADEIELALADRGMQIDRTGAEKKVMQRGVEVGTVKEWKPGERISFLWRPKTWEPATSELVITFSQHEGETTVSVEQRGWGHVVGSDAKELLGWFTGEMAAPLLQASSPDRLGDWITDRIARRPTGARSKDVYRNPLYHWPNFYAILDVLALRPEDHLLEVGCGGGAFLHEALKSGCTAEAIDHSREMVRLASETNRASLAGSRLKITLGDAGSLPYEDGKFTCAVMTGVLGFIPDPLQSFKEITRVLKSGGRFVAFTGSKEMKGTPAAPEPAASRLHFYENGELEDMARRAGFVYAKVEHPMLLEEARKAGVPESDLVMFKGAAFSQLLVARKA